jgi:DNA-binding winged helix-turn-helix (wHTH) protein
MRLSFGDFVLDTARRQLARGGTSIHLPPKAYRLLEVLIERRPAAVGKADLHQALWPGVFVGESSLSNLVTRLRDALGEGERGPGFVRTLHGFGYAFEGEVKNLDPAPPGAPLGFVCRIAWGDEIVDLPPGDSFIGRSPGVAIQIPDDRVSRRHARIRVGAAGATIEDLGSRNGTFLRGERIGTETPLADGDEIRIGQDRLVVRLVSGEVSTMTSVDSSLGAVPPGAAGLR